MKKPVMIAIIAIVIVAIIVAIIVGIFLNKPNKEDENKQQEITDAESFRNAMQEKGYIVMDAKNQFANYSKILMKVILIKLNFIKFQMMHMQQVFITIINLNLKQQKQKTLLKQIMI